LYSQPQVKQRITVFTAVSAALFSLDLQGCFVYHNRWFLANPPGVVEQQFRFKKYYGRRFSEDFSKQTTVVSSSMSNPTCVNRIFSKSHDYNYSILVVVYFVF